MLSPRPHSPLFIVASLVCAASVLCLGTHWARADDVTVDVIAMLRKAAQQVAAEPFQNGELWNELNAKENGDVLADIGLAQLGLKDLEGARFTASVLPPADKCLNCVTDGLFVRELHFALISAGEEPSAEALVTRHYSKPRSFNRLWIARAKFAADDVDAARAICRQEAAAQQNNPFDLCDVATAQIDIGDETGSRETRRSIEVAIAALPPKGQDRARSSAKLAVLCSRMGDELTARALIKRAAVEIDQQTLGAESALALIAAAHAKIGDVPLATQTIKLLPDGSGERDSAYKNVALVLWSRGELAAAQETILRMTPGSDTRNLVLLEIAKSFARNGDDKHAVATAAQIAHINLKMNRIDGQSRRTQALLEIAAIQATSGRIQEAQALVKTIKAPRGFDFNDAKTWKPKETLTIRPIISLSSHYDELEMERVTEGELVAAALRCYVLLKGKGSVPYIGEMNRWSVREAGAAQASVGDAVGALAWSTKLSEGRRVSALIGIAEGIAENQRPQVERATSRLGRRHLIRQHFTRAFLDD